MKKIFTAIFTVILAVTAMTSGNAFAANEKAESGNMNDIPEFFFIDENGDMTEIADVTVKTREINVSDISTMAMIPSIDAPDDNTNLFDLAEEQYVIGDDRLNSDFFAMDMWVHADTNGYLYVSAYMGDSEGTLHFYSFNKKTASTVLYKDYSLTLHPYNSRARYINVLVKNLDRKSTAYYMTGAESDGDDFSFGYLKASWTRISDLMEIDY